MARPKCVTDEELLKLLTGYLFDNPGSKVTIPEFGVYVRSHGFDEVQDYTIRRNKALREALDKANSNSDKQLYNDLVVYKTIDVDAFIEKNNSRAKLKHAIAVRDAYYSEIAAKAVKAINDKKALDKKFAEAMETVSQLEQNLLQAKNKDKVIVALRKIIDSYVAPAVAEILLAKEGITELVNSVVDNALVEQNTIHIDSDIYNEVKEDNKSELESVNNLYAGFDE